MTDRIEYPAEFVAMVNDEFAGSEYFERISPLLEEGSLMPLGHVLHEARLFDGSARHVHDMLYAGHARELQREAAIAERRELVYTEWYTIFERAKGCGASPQHDNSA